MGADLLVDPSLTCESSDDPGGVVTFHAATVVDEDRPVLSVAYGWVDRSGGARCHGNESRGFSFPGHPESVMSRLSTC